MTETPKNANVICEHPRITSLAFVPLVEIFEGTMPQRLPLFSVAAICGHAVLHTPGAAAAGLGVLRRGLQLRQDHAGEL